MRRVVGSPWITDFWCSTFPEVEILGADQKEHGLCEPKGRAPKQNNQLIADYSTSFLLILQTMKTAVFSIDDIVLAEWYLYHFHLQQQTQQKKALIPVAFWAKLVVFQ